MKTKRIGSITACALSLIFVLLLAIPLVGCGFDKTVDRAAKNLNNYDIEAVFSDDDKTIKATEIVTIKNTHKETMSTIKFHLYGKAFREDAKILPYTYISTSKCFPNGISYGDMQINSVYEGENPLNFSYSGQDNNILVIDKSLKKNESTKIIIRFELKLAECIHRLGWFGDAVNLGNWYPILCIFENGEFVCDPYYSIGDPFYSECSNYKVKFTFNSQYKVATTGQIKNEKIERNLTTVQVEAKAVRDFCIALNKNFEVVSGKVGETEINYFGYINDTDIERNLKTAKLALSTFNSIFGTYPYRTLNVVKTPFLFGGMEYPNSVWIADNISDDFELTKVIVHEIAHQWWYGLVGNNEVKYSYIDEALAEYSTILFFEKNESFGITRQKLVQENALSYQLYAEVIDSIGGTINDKLNQSVIEFQSEFEYAYVVYVRGSLFMDALRDKIGDKAFNNALKSYFKKYKFLVADRNALLKCFNKAAGDDLTDFFEEWKA